MGGCYIMLHKDGVMHNHSAGEQTLTAPYMMNDCRPELGGRSHHAHHRHHPQNTHNNRDDKAGTNPETMLL